MGSVIRTCSVPVRLSRHTSTLEATPDPEPAHRELSPTRVRVSTHDGPLRRYVGIDSAIALCLLQRVPWDQTWSAAGSHSRNDGDINNNCSRSHSMKFWAIPRSFLIVLCHVGISSRFRAPGKGRTWLCGADARFSPVTSCQARS